MASERDSAERKVPDENKKFTIGGGRGGLQPSSLDFLHQNRDWST